VRGRRVKAGEVREATPPVSVAPAAGSAATRAVRRTAASTFSWTFSWTAARSTVLATVLAAALGLGGCGTPPTRYYSLAGPLPEAAMPANGAPGQGRPGGANGAPVHIDVAPVGVPERLARPQMLIRNATRNDADPVSTQVDVLEQQRWVSPLDTELRDAFAGAISARAGAIDVTRGGRLPGQPVYRIAIRVGYLDAVLDRQVDAVFGWTITRSDDSRHAICEVSVSRPAGRGMDALVQAVKQSVAVAAEHIARQIMQLQESATAACDGSATGTATRPGPAGGSPDAAAEAGARDGPGTASATGIMAPAAGVAGARAAPLRASGSRSGSTTAIGAKKRPAAAAGKVKPAAWPSR
jgi:uncharacterized protein